MPKLQLALSANLKELSQICTAKICGSSVTHVKLNYSSINGSINGDEMKFLKTLALIFLIWAIVLVGIIGAALIARQTIPSEGTVNGIGVQVYWDSALTQPCTQLNWGLVENNTQVQRMIYVYNNGTSSETLTLTTSGWNATGLTLTWNREGYALPAQTTISAELTLKVATDAEAFQFDITITGTA